ncbi:MAG: hypothetical protein U9O54_05305 [Chloroflexota bacterium]|nr:hypothetical protein [Chloroflexota bacterium]
MFVFKGLVPPNENIEFLAVLEKALEWLYHDIYVGRVYLSPDAYWPEGRDILQAATERFWKSVDDASLPLSTKNRVVALMLTVSRRALIDVYDAYSNSCVRYSYSPNDVVEAIEPLPILMRIPKALTVLVKMQEGSLNDFSDEELKRVFKHLAGPAACFRIAKAIIVSGNLRSVDDIPHLITNGKPLYAESKVMQRVWGQSRDKRGIT